ncbi:hypothetical protein DM02DRAFT_660346 [Periconia macrospinosa]|uniref:Uncharacterized protein n=1 Tax=Periconia macrospinosa TaxID=97972 RepID=A0A2V1DDG2_9PLEO|nr:hypothetical protein DM02DRAFT_660346 [Periconia macrospinosa]
MPKRKRTGGFNVTEYSIQQVRAYAEEKKFADALRSLPPHSHLLWLPYHQKAAGNDIKQLYIGTLLEDGKEVRVFAYIDAYQIVRFRSGAAELEDRASRARLRLDGPFVFLKTDERKRDYPALESLIMFYFVAAGHYPKFIDGLRHKPNLRGLSIACKLIHSGIEKKNSESKTEGEQCDDGLGKLMERPEDVGRLLRQGVIVKQQYAALEKDYFDLERKNEALVHKQEKMAVLLRSALENPAAMTKDERRMLIREMENGLNNI